jgi:hypothetical protein
LQRIGQGALDDVGGLDEIALPGQAGSSEDLAQKLVHSEAEERTLLQCNIDRVPSRGAVCRAQGDSG